MQSPVGNKGAAGPRRHLPSQSNRQRLENISREIAARPINARLSLRCGLGRRGKIPIFGWPQLSLVGIQLEGAFSLSPGTRSPVTSSISKLS